MNYPPGFLPVESSPELIVELESREETPSHEGEVFLEMDVKHIQFCDDDQGKQALLGTFKGVFVPTLQNILGVILFIRLPWIAGQAGIGESLVIGVISCLATLLTSISLSAIATNGKVIAGGAYNIIKKSLGPEFGTAVGLLLFLSNAFSVALYALGAVESFQSALPSVQITEDQDLRVIGTITLFCLTAIVFVGMSFIWRFALLFLTGVVLSILSILVGAAVHTANPAPELGIFGFNANATLLADNWGPDYDEGWTFMAMLALYFPATTDPLAGSNLSGDLANPQQSIPFGTIAAVSVTTVIFLVLTFVMGGTCSREALKNDKLLVTLVAWPWPQLVYTGILLSTLGAGLQSLAGAPRLMDSIASDGLIPQLRFFKTHGAEPRRALALTFVIAQGAVLLGSLDFVAPFITMFFLTSYAIINWACFLLSLEESPNFRPSFRYFHWSLSLLGLIVCLAGMFLISWYSALIALFVTLVIYKYVQRNSVDVTLTKDGSKVDWRSGIRFQEARRSLLALETGDLELKYWRPFIMFLCKVDEHGTYQRQYGIINLLPQLMKRGRGLAIVGGVIEGAYREHVQVVQEANLELRKFLKTHKVDGFAEVITAPTRTLGMQFLLQGKGLNSLRPNTVMLGWPAPGWSDEHSCDYVNLLLDVQASQTSLMICRGEIDFPDLECAEKGNIDVWWVHKESGLMLLLAYLLRHHYSWKHCTLRLFSVVRNGEDHVKHELLLNRLVVAAGLRDTVVQVVPVDDELLRPYALSSAPRGQHEAGPADGQDGLQRKPSTLSGQLAQIALALQEPSRPPLDPIDVDEVEMASLTGDSENCTPLPAEVPEHRVFSDISEPTPSPSESREWTPLSPPPEAEQPERARVPSGRASMAAVDSHRALNAVLRRQSQLSVLVITNLPPVWTEEGAGPRYMRSVEALVDRIPRVMLVQESGKEKIQLYS